MVETEKAIEVVIYSFGFKYGAPEDATVVLDVRFLPNPYWVEGMRHLTGREDAVSEYVLESKAGRGLLKQLEPMVKFLFEQNRLAGKESMRIGIGCTGGQHRSVAVVERLGKLLKKEDCGLEVFHRDIHKE